MVAVVAPDNSVLCKMTSTVSDSIINCILNSNYYSKNCFVLCKTCQRSFNYVSKNFTHVCGNKSNCIMTIAF